MQHYDCQYNWLNVYIAPKLTILNSFYSYAVCHYAESQCAGCRYNTEHYYAECFYVGCTILSIVMLSVVILHSFYLEP